MEYRFKTKPYKHQKDCFERNCRSKYFAYLMEMGTGKSKVLLDTASFMYDNGWIDALIIFANKGSYQNWVTAEIPAHMPKHVEYQVALWRANANKTEINKIQDVANSQDMCLKIFVMNVEALAYDRSYRIAYDFVLSHKTLAVIDESTTIKNPVAKRTKAAHKIGKIAVARRIMTGSIVDNRPLDAFSQFEFLSKGALGFTSYYSFRSQYAELVDMQSRNSPRPFKVVTGYKNLHDLHMRLSKYSFIIKKDECLDLPPKIYEQYDVELSKEQLVAYNDLRKNSLTEIEGDIVSVKIVLTKLLRLHQLVCGHLKDDEGNIHDIPHNRMDALDAILDEIRGQVIIWANYRPDIIAIANHLKTEYGEESTLTYYGDTTDAERDYAKEVLKRGNDTKGVRFLVANPQTGGYGLTLTGANTVIYYSNSFDAEKRSQSEDRAHRIGQTDKVTYIDLVSKGTIDEKILKVLRGKKNLADTITASNWKEFF